MSDSDSDSSPSVSRLSKHRNDRSRTRQRNRISCQASSGSEPDDVYDYKRSIDIKSESEPVMPVDPSDHEDDDESSQDELNSKNQHSSDESSSESEDRSKTRISKLKKDKNRNKGKKKDTNNKLPDAQTLATPVPKDGSGTVDLNQLVNNSSGTGLLVGGAMPVNLDEESSSDEESSESDTISCNICTFPLRNVVKLKCKHKFCYACIKGHLLAKQRNCPFCQEPIKTAFIKMILTEPNKVCKKTEKIDKQAKSYWVYDSRGSNGWWNYDNKSNSFLERDYQNWLSNPNRASNGHRYTLMVCGTVMEIDFNLMAQINPTTGVSRKINRFSAAELRDLQERNLLKGIGGITTQNN